MSILVPKAEVPSRRGSGGAGRGGQNLREGRAMTTNVKKLNTGDAVIWDSKAGPVTAEYRGKLMGLDGWEATIICRDDAMPFQITVPLVQIRAATGEVR